MLRQLFPRRREALPSSRITLLSTCPALRPRWCPARLPWRGQDCCLAVTGCRRLWVRLPGLILLSTTIRFSEFNDAACVLALPLLRTPRFRDRTSVRLPTRWLAFGRVGLEYSSHPLGNFDMFQEVSPLSSHPEFSSARARSCWARSFQKARANTTTTLTQWAMNTVKAVLPSAPRTNAMERMPAYNGN